MEVLNLLSENLTEAYIYWQSVKKQVDEEVFAETVHHYRCVMKEVQWHMEQQSQIATLLAAAEPCISDIEKYSSSKHQAEFGYAAVIAAYFTLQPRLHKIIEGEIMLAGIYRTEIVTAA